MSDKFISAEVEGSTLILTMNQSVSAFANESFLEEIGGYADSFVEKGYQTLIVDFNQIPHFGSSVLEGLCSIWEEAKKQGARHGICNLSPVGLSIIQISRFDTLWEIFDTRQDALNQITSSAD